jgi:hypothetical protein
MEALFWAAVRCNWRSKAPLLGRGQSDRIVEQGAGRGRAQELVPGPGGDPSRGRPNRVELRALPSVVE